MTLKNEKTICTLLTPSGRGAVAVIALSGLGSLGAVDKNFEPVNGKPYSQLVPRKIVYGVWRSTQEDLVLFNRNSSEFEIHCHGGNTASAAIIADLQSLGIENVSPIEFVAGAENQWQAEVLQMTSQATTPRTANLLHQQVNLLPNAIKEIESKIESNESEPAIEAINAILKWSDFGIHLTQPRSIVFCGRPNVGKSSLVNAIAGFQRAIVHDVAGTTRDVVTQVTAIDGWPVELKDTAGLRDSENKIEAIGIGKARSQIETANLKVCVFDLSSQWSEADQQTLDSIQPDLVVFNKCDLTAKTKQAQANEFYTSATGKVGIEDLMEGLIKKLIPTLPPKATPFPVSAGQVKRLSQTLELLKADDSTKAIETLQATIDKT